MVIRKKQIKSRYLFSNSVLRKKYWFYPYLISDECLLYLTNDGLIMCYRKREDTSYTIIMVYGAIGLDFKRGLVFCGDSIKK